MIGTLNAVVGGEVGIDSRLLDNLRAERVGICCGRLTDKSADERMKTGQLRQRALVHVEGVLVGMADHLPQTYIVPAGTFHDFLLCGVAYSACGIIDDAAKSLLIARVYHHSEIGDDILDFLALIETLPAIDAVAIAHAHLGLAHFLLKVAALGIGAVQDGEVSPLRMFLTLDASDLLTYHRRLALVGDRLKNGDLLALLVLAEYLFRYLSRVVFHQRVGGRHDVSGGAIVAL